ncbi:MAG: MFS transporter [Candidatus Bathyarchaeota archaeon]|nr:MFS transporter [Candidatus Bathyarchaeota archaeon]
MGVLGRHLALEGNIRVLAVQIIVSQFGFGMFYVVWQPYILSTGVSVVSLGVVQSVINLSSASGSIVWGVLSDRFGRKPIMLASNASRVLALLALVLSGDFTFLVAFGFFVGFSALFMQGNPARMALISESVGDKRRATAYSTIMSVSQITSTITASAGGYLAVTAGYHLIFYICMAGDIVGLLLVALFIEETREERSSGAEPERSLAARVIGNLKPEPGVGPLYLIMVVMGVGYSTGFSLLYGTLVDSYGFTPFQLGLLSTAFNLTWGISSIPLGKLSDRFGRWPLLMASWTMAVITVLGFLASRSFVMFLIFEVTSALDPALWIPAWMALLAEKAPSRGLSTVMGKLDFYSRLAGIPAPWVGGLLYSSLGFAAPLAVHLICLMVSGALIFSLREA